MTTTPDSHGILDDSAGGPETCEHGRSVSCLACELAEAQALASQHRDGLLFLLHCLNQMARTHPSADVRAALQFLLDTWTTTFGIAQEDTP